MMVLARLLFWTFLALNVNAALGQTDRAAVLAEVQQLRGSDPQAALLLLDQALADIDPDRVPQAAREVTAELLELRASILRGLAEYEAAVEDAERLARLAASAGDPGLAALAAFMHGSIEAEQGHYAAALERFHAARGQLESIDRPRELARLYNAIGVTHNFTGDQARAREYFQRALDTAEAVGDEPLAATYLGNLALTVADLEGAEAALPLLEEVLRLGQQTGSASTVTLARANLCDQLVVLDRRDQAEVMCQQALEDIDAMGESRWQAGIRLTLGQLRQRQGRLEEAVGWYQAALDIASESVPTVEDDILAPFSETLIALDRPAEALALAQRRLALRDEQRERERRDLIEELEVRYEVERSAADLDLLRLQSELQTTQIRQRNQLLIALVAILVVALLAVLGAVRSYRIKAALEQDLAVRNEALEKALDHISELARHDSLTGLLNRRALEELGRREVGLRQRHGHPLAVVLMDVDYFKTINDRFGHAVGDEVLQGFASILRENLREGDLVGRWGGEEFVCLLPGTDLAAAEQMVGRIQAALKKRPIKTSAEPVRLTVTCGIAPAGDRLDQAIDAADQAMYRGKQAGRDAVVVADDEAPAMA
ncbi:MAG: diguanylate cyclase [Wenzhouxiangella sp.]